MRLRLSTSFERARAAGIGFCQPPANGLSAVLLALADGSQRPRVKVIAMSEVIAMRVIADKRP
jgi:hypothetical protein